MAESGSESTSEPLHFAVVGGGVAGCAAASWAATRGVRVTIFNAGLPLGGTCIHIGTFPARMLMSAATDHHRAAHPRFAGVDTGSSVPDWTRLNDTRRQMGQEIRDHFQRRLSRHPRVELVEQKASFVDETTLRAGDKTYEADRILLTPGTHSMWPEVPGLDATEAIGIGDLGDLDGLPDRVLFVDINDDALAYAQLLSRFGVDVTILTEERRLVGEGESDQIDDAVVELLTGEGVDIAVDVDVDGAGRGDDGCYLEGTVDGEAARWTTDVVVLVDHRRPRTQSLGLDVADVDVDDNGLIVIDESLQTTNPAVFAAGDAIGRDQHAYAAAYDAILAARNAISPSRTAGHNTAVPFAIYTDPQLAGVGWSEPRARDAGFLADTAIYSLERLPAARAMGCERGFVKLVRDRRSDHLVGARVMAPNASELVMELALTVRYGLTVSDLAAVVHPPISMGEAIGEAARRFTRKRPKTGAPPPSRPGAG